MTRPTSARRARCSVPGEIAGFSSGAIPHPAPRPRSQGGLWVNLQSRMRAGDAAKKATDAIDSRPPLQYIWGAAALKLFEGRDII